MRDRKLHAALAIACLALALSIYTAVRGPGGRSAAGSSACIDQEARDQTDKLRRELAARDVQLARLARAAAAPGGGPAAVEPPPPSSSPPSDPGPRRYTHFEITNPAVTVTQREDGTLDIRTTDPALAGSVMPITAVTGAGEEDRFMIRIP
jgi:hypothetical protein